MMRLFTWSGNEIFNSLQPSVLVARVYGLRSRRLGKEEEISLPCIAHVATARPRPPALIRVSPGGLVARCRLKEAMVQKGRYRVRTTNYLCR